MDSPRFTATLNRVRELAAPSSGTHSCWAVGRLARIRKLLDSGDSPRTPLDVEQEDDPRPCKECGKPHVNIGLLDHDGREHPPHRDGCPVLQPKQMAQHTATPSVADTRTTEKPQALICAACGQTDSPVVEVPLHPRCTEAAQGAAPRAEGLDPRRLFDEMWAERDVLDAGTKGFSPNRYRSAARRIVARLSRPPDERVPEEQD